MRTSRSFNTGIFGGGLDRRMGFLSHENTAPRHQNGLIIQAECSISKQIYSRWWAHAASVPIYSSPETKHFTVPFHYPLSFSSSDKTHSMLSKIQYGYVIILSAHKVFSCTTKVFSNEKLQGIFFLVFVCVLVVGFIKKKKK